MDEFGGLVESIGFRAHGKSSPMAKSKPKPQSHFPAHNKSAVDDSHSLPVDELDGIFRSNVNVTRTQKSQNFFGGDDVFGGSVSSSHPYGGIDLDSVFSTSSNRRNNSSNLNSRNPVGSASYDDLLGSIGPKSNSSGAVDDLFGMNRKQEKIGGGWDDLVPGIGGTGPSMTKVHSDTAVRPSNSRSGVIDDPFLVFETSSVPKPDASWPFDIPSKQDIRKGSTQSSIDDFGDFVTGTTSHKTMSATTANATFRVHSDASEVRPSNSSSSVIDDPFLVFESSTPKPDTSWPFDTPSNQNTREGSGQSSFDDFVTRTASNKNRSATTLNGSGNTDYVDAIFGGGSNGVRQNYAAKPSSTDEYYPFGDFFHEKKQPEVKHTPPSSFSTKKNSFPKNVGNDFTSLFGDIATSSGEFHEMDGEPEERRKARLNRHMRTNARMAEALAEKNQRDLQSRHEQEEKRRLAESLSCDIKRWAAGKEGNLRALLSSLQQVLWPECGWRPVSLTDMITSQSVKKVYMKAALCVHPDKVQQKGATVQQKYIAEKVFDILKEAWNKFSLEELR